MHLRSYLIIVVMVCTLGGLSLSAIISWNQGVLETYHEEVDSKMVLKNDIGRLSDHIKLSLLSADLLFGSLETYMLEVSQQQAKTALELCNEAITHLSERPGSSNTGLLVAFSEMEVLLISLRNEISIFADQMIKKQTDKSDSQLLRVDEITENIVGALKNLSSISTDAITISHKILQQEKQHIELINTSVFIFYIVGVVLTLLWASRAVSRPLIALSQSAKKALTGSTAFKVKLDGPLEVRELTQHTADFVASLENKINQTNALFSAIPDAIFVFNSKGGFKRIKPGADFPVPLAREELDPKSLRVLLGEFQYKSIIKKVMQCLESKALVQYEFVITQEGKERYCELRATAIDAHQAVLIIRDLTGKREAEKKIQHLAFHDDLTGLLNRNAFKKRIEQFVLQNEGMPFCLLFLDVDKFKTINDVHGHEVGDRMLRHIARCLDDNLRSGDAVGRYKTSQFRHVPARIGGDEFMVLLPKASKLAGVDGVSKRLLDAIASPLSVNGSLLTSSASIGVSFYPEDGTQIDELINHADLAMFQAKKGGGNICVAYDKSMGAVNRRKISLEAKLRKAIDNDELFLVYQPKIELSTYKIVGAEALVRWQDGDRVISPLEFIPIAEETGLILPIGDRVLSMATSQLAQWKRNGHDVEHVAINVAASQFKQPHFQKSIIDTMDKAGLSYSMLNIEVTESMFIQEFDHAVSTLVELHELGFTISMDDFGTGYSSLSYLTRMPLDVLKIDRAFVSGMMNDLREMAIVETIVQLGKTLSLRIVAEGIETKEQLSVLANIGCHEAQGYYFSPPIDADLFEQFCSSKAFSGYFPGASPYEEGAAEPGKIFSPVFLPMGNQSAEDGDARI